MNKDTTTSNINFSGEITQRFISLEKILVSKNKYLLKIIPKPLLKWFKKLICLDRVNEVIYKYRDYQGVDFADCVLKEIDIKIKVINPHNIPKEGRALIASNHPLGGIDGMALISEVGKYRRDILFPVNDILCQLPGLKSVFIPINKYGRNSSNHDALNNAFASDSCMMFFPAGTESKKINGRIQDFKWKKSFLRKAQEYGRDIVPVYIDSVNSKRFYRLSAIRRFFRIEFDLEMILLPSEMFKKQGETITITFGQPVKNETFDNRFTPLEWANKLREYVYQLKEDPEKEFKA
ncbi:MAG: 1-acyl-sn-glycerol-3-phosphate acyltransferase [Bacteroidales bacterium]|jgi:putative hemolysin|nr:1-acyl-sn-glycerol-3-phosphate acyltransferase [Bacteroidales bacterium]MDX9797275.1 1-acyl-sn-glycerol-3-phosphate acyltransferase [Bacteroidales bacterium]